MSGHTPFSWLKFQRRYLKVNGRPPDAMTLFEFKVAYQTGLTWRQWFELCSEGDESHAPA